MKTEIWALAEQKEGELADISFGLLSEASKIAPKLGGEVCAVLVGSSISSLVNRLADYGADKVYLIDSPELATYTPEYYVPALSGLIQDRAPEVLLCGAILSGRDLAPRLAARLKTGLVSNCTSLEVNGEGLLSQTKSVYGGKVGCSFVCPTARPQIATLAPDIMTKKYPTKPGRGEVITYSPELGEVSSRMKVVDFIKADPRTLPLKEAEVIIDGGRGVGSAENFKLLEVLAELLAGTVAASRVAYDEGWVSRDRQIGQTGEIISPKLCITCGISGASQHLVGMRDSDFIIAINTDANAPIFQIADIAVVGDLLQIVPCLIEQLRSIEK